MAEQLTLDSAPVVDVARSPLEARYRHWLAANPWVLDEVARTTRQLIAATGTHPTIAQVWEELRHRHHTAGDTYRFNNSWRAFASRDVMDRHPDLAGVFRVRRSKADRRREHP